MLNPRFKSLHLIFSFIGYEEGLIIVKEYDKKSLYTMLLKVLSSFTFNGKN
jgi:hypothetical protein